MEKDFVVLTEKERMWAEMLVQVLKDNHVFCVTEPVFGFAFTFKTGTAERLRVLVPAEQRAQAEDLLFTLFPEDRT